jgi:heme exporter protein A
LSFVINAGEALQIVGRNGSGKTTLLRTICGLTRSESGHLNWRGEPLDQNKDAYRSELLYVGHENGLKFELSPLENLRTLRDIAGRSRNITLEDALHQVGLRGYEERPVRLLSSGQRRRVALAKLIVVNASLWLLDEPFTNLDVAGTGLVNKLVAAHLDSGGALLFTSHAPLSLPRGTPFEVSLDR